MKSILVIPCFNESRRINHNALKRLFDALSALDFETEVLFVDDGSTDDTADILEKLTTNLPAASVLRIKKNGGKAEAVRHGLNVALENGAQIVGYCDADFATPPEEVVRLLVVTSKNSDNLLVIGSRVLLLGHAIRRSAMRHYVGRIFATITGSILGIGVYDTQCGAKWFRECDALRSTLGRKFRSRWGFDVEIIGRLLKSGVEETQMREVPLNAWQDVGGSKITVNSGLRTLIDLALIRRDLRRWPQ